MDMDDELARQYGQLSLSENMGMESFGDNGDNDDMMLKNDGACNLIVNYLPHDVDDLALRALFQDFGEIIMTKVVRDKNTKKSMGYGFVKFLDEEDAMKAIEKMNGFGLGHKNLKVSVARPPSLEIRNCKLYVTNLPKDFTERDVIALFKEFGEIIECRVLKDRNSKVNKGVAFVQFNVKAQANNALSLNGCQLEGSSRPLVVKYAEDQHKKKELSRLHNLTINNAFRGMNSMGGPNGMPSPKPQQRMDNMNMNMNMNGNKNDMLNTAYFYQQQGLPSLYGQSSPMSMLPSPLNANNIHSNSNNWFNTLQPSQMSYMQGMQNPGLQLNMQNSQLGSQSLDMGYNPLAMPSMPLMGGQQHSMSPSMAQHNGMGNNNGHNMRGPSFGGAPSPKGLGMGTMSMMGEHMDHNHRNLQLNMNMNMGYAGPSPLHTSGLQHMPPSPSNSTHTNSMPPGAVPGTGSQSTSPHSQYPTLIISNLPSMADVSMLHELCAPHGRIVSATLEDSRRSANGGTSGSSGSPGVIRGRVQMDNISQAEQVAQYLHGAVLFEGAPPLQVQIALMQQHRM